MNLDLDVCAYVFRTGDLEGLLKAGVSSEHLVDSGKEVFAALQRHYLAYGRVPSRVAFQLEFPSFDLRDFPEGKESKAYYVSELKKRHIEITIRTTLAPVIELIEKKQPNEALAKLQSAAILAANCWGSGKRVVTMADNAEKRKQAYLLAEASKGVTGITLPWPTMTMMTGGLQPGDYMGIVGETGIGKTHVLSYITQHVMTQGPKILAVSREMRVLSWQRRFSCYHGNFSMEGVKRGSLDPAERQRYLEFEDGWGEHNNLKFADDGSVNSVDDLFVLVETEKPDVLCVDSAYLLDEGGKAIWERVSSVSKKLRFLALQKQVLVIASYQFNVEKKKDDLTVSLSWLAHGARQAGLDADLFIALACNKRYRIEKKMKLCTLKVREASPLNIDIHWDLDRADLSEIGISDDNDSEDEEHCSF